MTNALIYAWRWDDDGESVNATWRIGGWPRYADTSGGRPEPCRSTLARRTVGLPPCTKPAEWKVERRRGRRVTTTWYCTGDLPSTEAPPIDAERTDVP